MKILFLTAMIMGCILVGSAQNKQKATTEPRFAPPKNVKDKVTANNESGEVKRLPPPRIVRDDVVDRKKAKRSKPRFRPPHSVKDTVDL